MDLGDTAHAAWTGQSLERIEDESLLRGRGQFADDLGVKPGTLFAAVVRSPHAHATLDAVDTAAALALPGVHAVLTREHVTQWSQPFVVGVKAAMQCWCMAVDKVRYVGEPVAVVLATSRALAEDGADRVAVRYTPLSAVIGIVCAMQPEAAVLHDAVGSNVVSDRSFCYGAPQAAFASAAHRISIEVEYPRNSCTPIETGAVVAEYLGEHDGYDALSNFMGPFSLHTVMAIALKVPAARLRHRTPRDSGGSFGVKQSVLPYVVLMCLASRLAGRPVKWVEDRLEHLSAATSATARRTLLSAAVEADGRVTALDFDQMDECGGYLRAPEPATFYRMHGALTGAYDIAHLAVRNRVVLTNKTPTGLVRGFGGPQVYYALERLMQRIATELQLDPCAVIQRNLVPTAAFPYRAAAGALLDSGDYPRLVDMARNAADMPALLQRQQQARAAGRLVGIGYAAVVEPSISNMGYISTVLTPEARAKAGPKNGALACATVSIDATGAVTVLLESAPAGQGHRTVTAQVVADVFGLRVQDITVAVDFDTVKDAHSVAAGNYSSRFAGAAAGTAHIAAQRLRDKLVCAAAAQWAVGAASIRLQGGQVLGPNGQKIPFSRLAGSFHWAPATVPKDLAPGLRETAFWTPEVLTAPDADDRVNTSAAYGFVFDICMVEVQRETGRVQILKYVTAHDAGTLLNPMLADGQIRGGFAQGVGAALYEEFRYGADGSFLSGTFADYLVPTACEIPEPVIVHLETPSPFTPLGAKGLAEGNNMSTPVAIANAVADALLPIHPRTDIRLPLTPARVLALIDDAEPVCPARLQTMPTAPSAAALKGGLGLHAQGTVELAATPQQVFDVLLDPVALARVIPGCHALARNAHNCYRADVTLAVGPIKARFSADIVLSDIDAPHRLRLSGSGASALGTATGSGLIELVASANGSRLSYNYQAGVSGKVAAVGGRMLEGAAKVLLNQLFQRLGQVALGHVASVPPASVWQRLRRWLGWAS